MTAARASRWRRCGRHRAKAAARAAAACLPPADKSTTSAPLSAAAVADLGRLCVESIKLDRRLVRDVVLDPESRSRATALLRLARALGLSTAAGGIETEAQAELLRGAGCEILQGYRFHRPLEVDALHAAMQSAPAMLAA